ncbi:MAG TPA: SMC-Scp complex subunit ScpB [Acidimicrobiaceae bacterium]|nr:SMC-Scp complex subunit ScpB [Acidimicrobiaceae bacterium]|tara:strand:+ start:2040 stop:2780 length:741 start_codon:yes stop_codon:yes gene_type:complete
MTANDDADTFEVLAAQLETEGSLVDSDPLNAEVSDLDPTLVPADVRAALEAILIVASDPVAPTVLAQLLEVSVDTVEALCGYLADSYAQEERGFTIAQVAGGFRFQTAEAQAPYVERFVLEGQTTRLSTAALETLSIVAYKQPVSRAQIASIRGVNVDGVVRTLQQRGYIAEVGRDPGPGNAAMYGTTTLFLERIGLNSLDELPNLSDFVPDADVVETLEAVLRGGDEGTPESGSKASPEDLSPPA